MAQPLYGAQTRYKYRTQDGLPPNMGAPPSVNPRAGVQPPPPYSPVCNQPAPPGMWCYPNQPQGPPGQYFVVDSNNGMGPAVPFMGVSPPQAGYMPVQQQQPPPPPPPPQAPAAQGPAKNTKRSKPYSGNRVNGQIVTVPHSGAGVITGKMATLHIFRQNIIAKHTPDAHGRFYMPISSRNQTCSTEFTVQHISLSSTVADLIDGIDCASDAPANWPPYDIGIQEVLELGNGWWQVGSKFTLDDTPRTSQTIGNVFSEFHARGSQKPRWVVRVPF